VTPSLADKLIISVTYLLTNSSQSSYILQLCFLFYFHTHDVRARLTNTISDVRT